MQKGDLTQTAQKKYCFTPVNTSTISESPICSANCLLLYRLGSGAKLETVDRVIPSSKTPHDEGVVRLFEEARRRLVETGTRNRLIHVNRSNTRGPILNLINERSEDVYATLSARKTMRFLARGQDKTADSKEMSLALPDPVESMGPSRFTDEFLETPLGPDGLQKKLLSIAQEARTAEEEQGVNILYLALGFLTWYEDKTSRVPRVAPLILLPVDLVRNERTSTFDIRMRDEDLIVNLPLSIRLRDDFGIQLPDLEVEEEWTPSSYFDLVAEAITHWPSWSIERDGMQLGFFSFSKLLMYQDLSPDSWPDGSLKTHALTRGLLFEGFEGTKLSDDLDKHLDEALPPAKLFHVIDADASQAIAIEEVRSGRNLVIQGPPGTGKSQTICNIIATAVREGKTVLFVAEKMAALSVVYDRLVKVGMRDVCLELHSKSANKKAVLEELSRTLDAAQAIPRVPNEPTQLTAARDRLNRIAEALHQPIGESGETGIGVLARQARYLGMGYTPPKFASAKLLTMSRADEDELCRLIDEYGKHIMVLGSPDTNPLRALKRLDLQPTDLARATALLEQAIVSLDSLLNRLEACVAALGIERPLNISETQTVLDLLHTVAMLPSTNAPAARACMVATDHARLNEALEAGKRWKEAANAARDHFLEQALEAPVFNLRAALAAGQKSFFSRLGSSYKQASTQLGGYLSGPIPKSADDRLALVEELIHVQSLRKQLRDDEAYCAQCLGPLWRGEQTDFVHLQPVGNWLSQVERSALKVSLERAIALAENRSQLDVLTAEVEKVAPASQRLLEQACSALSLDMTQWTTGNVPKVSLRETVEQLRLLQFHLKDYISWASSARARAKMIDLGLESIVLEMHAGTLLPDAAAVELRFARAERLWAEARSLHPLLQELDGVDRHELVKTFAALERSHLRDNVTHIRNKHLSHVPTGALGEMKVVRGEIAKRRRHIPLRRLMNSASSAIQRIKPVLLMSPISVAQYLQPGVFKFDLLVIDEASQVRPEDALGAVARAEKLVVVGDPRQLPPTSFFDRLLLDGDNREDESGEDENEDLLEGAAKLEEMESILTLCEARGLGRRMLKWHYRSKDPSLIEVSNAEFYDNELVLLPSPLKSDPRFGLCFTQVSGVYDRGGKRDNRLEGEALVRKVAEHARTNPEQSLGIATFSVSQRSLITELLELARRSDRTLDGFLSESSRESVFVKNIENIQGDERDVILISVCYGPVVAGGRLSSLSFGPVNSEGGGRRLNVLFTRARLRCEVFASFDPSEIDLSRARGEGVRIFKRYLDFAKNGKFEQDTPTGEAAETALEQDVADVIREMGFLADPQVGSSGFRIDIGVRHPSRPGSYLLAVECDGATYHHALWARERDRMRQEVLEHLGWRFHRVWSTDWFYRRSMEIERLREALFSALNCDVETATYESKEEENFSLPTADPESNVIADEIHTFEPIHTRDIPLYVRATLPVDSSVEPHEASPELLEKAALAIVKVEGPIHEDEVARRVASFFGKERAGARIIAVVKAALERAGRYESQLLSETQFWFIQSQKEKPMVRDRSQEEGTVLKAEYISLFELRAALEYARTDNGGGSDSELIRAASRYLGFRRVGPDLQRRLQEALDQLEQGPSL